jgi:hypothetical protein
LRNAIGRLVDLFGPEAFRSSLTSVRQDAI